MNLITQGVSAAAGVVCLVLAVLMWFPGGRQSPRLAAIFVLTGVAGLLGTVLGQLARSGVGWADAHLAGAIGEMTGTAVVGLIALVATYVLVMHLKNNSVDEKTLGAAAVVPVAASTLPGPAGAALFTAITAVTSVIGWVIGAALGLI